MKKNKFNIVSIILLAVVICYLTVIGITDFANTVMENPWWYSLLNSMICILLIFSFIFMLFKNKKCEIVTLLFAILLVIVGSTIYVSKKNELKYIRVDVGLEEGVNLVEATVGDESVAKVKIKNGALEVTELTIRYY